MRPVTGSEARDRSAPVGEEQASITAHRSCGISNISVQAADSADVSYVLRETLKDRSVYALIGPRFSHRIEP